MRAAGFAKLTGRKAWRFNEPIDMTTFRSLSSYIAADIGSTTYYFALTSSVFYWCLDLDLDRPETYHLTFTFEGSKILRQPWFPPRSIRRDLGPAWCCL